jgi:hypothetical protein
MPEVVITLRINPMRSHPLMQSQRPLAITVVCIIRYLGFGLILFSVPALYGVLIATYGAW